MVGPEPNGVIAVFRTLEGAESALEWLRVAVGAGMLAATTVLGALASALVGVGIHDRQARACEKAIADHKFILVLHSDDLLALRTAKTELAGLGAESVEVHGIAT
jgi:hypothetical protein